MALIHFLATRQAMTDLVVDAIDGGTTDTTGDLILMAAADSVVASLTWSATPAFGAADGSAIATMNAINADTNATAGTLVAFKFQDRDNGEIFRGSIGALASGEDIEMTSVTIGTGETVSITTVTYAASQ